MRAINCFTLWQCIIYKLSIGRFYLIWICCIYAVIVWVVKIRSSYWLANLVPGFVLISGTYYNGGRISILRKWIKNFLGFNFVGRGLAPAERTIPPSRFADVTPFTQGRFLSGSSPAGASPRPTRMLGSTSNLNAKFNRYSVVGADSISAQMQIFIDTAYYLDSCHSPRVCVMARYSPMVHPTYRRNSLEK